MYSNRSLEGMTAMITGASSGIGAATALVLAHQGAHLVLHYNSKPREAMAIKKEVDAEGVTCDLVQADLSTMAGIRNLADFAMSKRVDILINNAGSLIRRTRVLEFTEELWESVIQLNFTSAFFLSQAVVPSMIERKRGAIVNVSSVAARTGGNVGALAYAAAKAAVSTMTKGLAREFAGQGIRVNAVSPGTIDTPYHQDFSTKEALAAVSAATPLGRLGKSEEVAEVIAFLSSERASFIQGQTIEINGGFLMA
jgi:3-oxoacyl-[acyl-carrier protein] reductase